MKTLSPSLAAQPLSKSPRLPVSPSPSLAAQPLSPSPSLSAFDPALPEDGALVIAGVLRDQFNGLAEMIEAVPTISSAVVDAVNTLPAGDPAEVSVSVMADVLHLTFGIPMGQSGPPGEVTTAALNAAISTTSSNSNAVVNLNELAEGTYNQTQMQNVINKLDELINALRR
jgi:hypothetical protein